LTEIRLVWLQVWSAGHAIIAILTITVKTNLNNRMECLLNNLAYHKDNSIFRTVKRNARRRNRAVLALKVKNLVNLNKV
jgi:hypothetical protein